MEIWYYLNGVRYASRRSNFIPRVGDEVRLNTGLFTVVRVVWIEDEPVARVAIDIEFIAVKPKKKVDGKT